MIEQPGHALQACPGQIAYFAIWRDDYSEVKDPGNTPPGGCVQDQKCF